MPVGPIRSQATCAPLTATAASAHAPAAAQTDEAQVPAAAVAEIAARLYEGGNGAIYEVVLSDTIGTGTPGHMARLLRLTSTA